MLWNLLHPSDRDEKYGIDITCLDSHLILNLVIRDSSYYSRGVQCFDGLSSGRCGCRLKRSGYRLSVRFTQVSPLGSRTISQIT